MKALTSLYSMIHKKKKKRKKEKKRKKQRPTGIIKANRKILTRILKSLKFFTYSFLSIIQIRADINVLFQKKGKEERERKKEKRD